MIWLAAPLGLLALLALAVPLVVHLWRPPPRTVRIGSLRLLREASRPPVRDLRWRERLLLALRCALLAAAALLLAQPLWPRADRPGARWALRSPMAQPTAAQSAAWAELLREGYEERWLAPGFPRERPSAGPPPDVWSLLAETDARVGAGGHLAVLAPTELRSLAGARPALARPVRWMASDGAAEFVWLVGRTEEGRVQVGISTPAQVRHLTVEGSPEIRVPGTSARLRTRQTASGREAALNDEAFAPLPTLAPLRVSVQAAPDRTEDERRVRAAVSALGWRNVGADETPDWVVQLGDLPLSAGRAPLLRDAGAAEANPGGGKFAGHRLRQRAAATLTADDRVLLRDAFGEPLLTERAERGRRVLRLWTRFQPDWMEAAEQSALPLWLAQTLTPGAPPPNDLRRVDPAQAQPALASAPAVSHLPAAAPTDLSAALWWLLAALLVAERLLSHRPSPASA
ncbi:MAG: BatA domain-containing protein [Verrucomicrobia bacterium]|nr:BatA domain-containing protein [Verrucomicrobiota bacterium]